MSRSAWLLLAISAFSALPALAQTEPAPPAEESSEPIVVTGKTEPPPRREVYEQALEVSRIDPGTMYEQALARLTAPLCADVVGLDSDLAGEMVARIRANAEQLKLRVARGRCAPNLLVAFAEDGHELLAELTEKHPRMLEIATAEERDELLDETAPVRVWNIVETKWANGAPLAYRHGKPELPAVRGRLNQMLLPTRNDIDFALIVYDREAVLGMTTMQLADYATMRGLSHTRPASGAQPMSTILALFDDQNTVDPGDREPGQLTSFDLGYLRSVYFWKPENSVPAVGRLLGVRRRAGEAMEQATGE